MGTQPIAQNATAWEYLLPDALGSVRQIADVNGNVTLAKSYEPYGSVLNSSGSASSMYGFTGEQIGSLSAFELQTGQPRGTIRFAGKATLDPLNAQYSIAATDKAVYIYFGDSGELIALSLPEG